MALPTSRDFTLAPGSEIPSALLNTLQDIFVQGAHSDRTAFIPPAGARLLSGGPPTIINTEWTSATSGGTVTGVVPLTLGLRAGERLKRVRLYGREGNLAGEVFGGRLVRADSGSVGSTFPTKTSGFTGARTFLEWNLADAPLSPDGKIIGATLVEAFLLEFTMGQTSTLAEVTFTGVEILWDRPLV